MVFFGDSITQHMREPSNWPVFQKYFASKYRAYPLGVGSAPCTSFTCHCAACYLRSVSRAQVALVAWAMWRWNAQVHHSVARTSAYVADSVGHTSGCSLCQNPLKHHVARV